MIPFPPNARYRQYLYKKVTAFSLAWAVIRIVSIDGHFRWCPKLMTSRIGGKYKQKINVSKKMAVL